ncbi:hypothetical protein HUU61_17880 [Rhodopseudomonas palustris]|nr:hypothetical protein [Rhodopseudomonas palustris]
MAKPFVDTNKKGRGRPSTGGRKAGILVRLLDEQLADLDRWIERRDAPMTRPEAIRRLVELGLTVKALGKPTNKAERSSRALDLATRAVEKLSDPAANPELRRERRKMLIKGPSEFRTTRVDLPKRKS